MEKMQLPSVDVHKHQQEFRTALLSTKKTALLGTVLLILPLFFLGGVLLKHYLNIDFGLVTAVYQWIGDLDRRYGDSSVLNWIIRILLLFGPLIAMAVNLLAVVHIRYEKPRAEIIMSLKLKWTNWLIIGLCGVIFSVFFLYLVVENL